jgi:hypothetical protein
MNAPEAVSVNPLAERLARDQRMLDGQKHAEAFYLMRYECGGRLDLNDRAPRNRSPGCGHHEIMWNSRDGVTPFGTQCPSCGGDLLHTAFGSDRYAPGHKPHIGQRVWRGGTRAEWESAYLRTVMRNQPSISRSEAETIASEYAREAVERGEPWLEVHGYAPVIS